ncbi:thiamine-phosphate pyrophosphorylase [Candidatus Omnitrophota bacterium]
MDRKLYRIIDANYNRSKEALRVIEDIFRFFLDDKTLTKRIKSLRHELTTSFNDKKIVDKMLMFRDSLKDIGRPVDTLELKRKNINDVIYANLQRAKESARVLEEIFKIIDKKSVSSFKTIRYNLYSLEKSIHKKLETTGA